ITVKLDLKNNNFQMLPRGAFLHTPYLTHLSLHRCSIIKVKEGAFRGLGRVVYLNLAYNKIDILYQESLDGLSSLKELHLDHNHIEEIQPGAFIQLGFLSMLALTHNHLVYIPNMAFQVLENSRVITKADTDGLQNIKWLRLSYNSLNNLAPEAFAGLFTLSRLSLDHNELQFFPTLTMMRLPEVKRLELSFNPMTYLGEESVLMGKLTHLYLDHMSLQDVSDQAFSQARLLSHVDLGHNQLRYLEPLSGPTKLDTEAHHATCESRGYNKVPRGFSPRTQLLDLRGNHFHFIPSSSFPGTGQVVSLHMEFCKIHEIEGGAFQGMRNLLYLYLSDNDLMSLEPKTFAGVPQLTYLHLEGNRLTQFPGAALSLVPNLFVLHLERNAISKLEPAGLLSSAAPKLMELYLSNNTISVIAKGALSFALIKTFHLDSNQLTEVPADALTDVPHLEELNLSQNSVRWVGPRTFQDISQSLQRLYMDQMGIEKMSTEALLGLGPGLKVLTVRGNQLKELPDLSALTGLEMIDMRDNPLLCDCALLPLRRWMESVRLEVSATCGHPLGLRGQQVGDTNVFATCPDNTTALAEAAAVGPRPVKMKSTRAKTRPEKLKLDKLPRGQHRRKAAKQKKAKYKKMKKANRGN
ncbi:hypothetical protein XENORESO_021882, partial [Xenotaenia resolanae]